MKIRNRNEKVKNGAEILQKEVSSQGYLKLLRHCILNENFSSRFRINYSDIRGAASITYLRACGGQNLRQETKDEAISGPAEQLEGNLRNLSQIQKVNE